MREFVPDLIVSLGGIRAVATALSDRVNHEITYDRVYQWTRKKFVPGWALLPLGELAKEAGRPLTKAELAALVGPVRRRLTKKVQANGHTTDLPGEAA